LVGLFRNRAMLARELLAAFSEVAIEVAIDDVASAEVASVDLSQAVSTEYRADSVTLLRDGRGDPVLAVVVEVQLRIDPRKARTWPVYVTTARANLDCPVVLLVLAPSASVAEWARSSIPIGHPGFQLRPLVISENDVPRILDRARAERSPELAVLSAISHRSREVAEVAIAALLQLPEDESRLYFDAILEALPASDLSALEARLSYEYQSAFARKYIAMGRAEGRNEGRAEGRNEGRAEGRDEGRAEGRNEGRAEGRNEGRAEGRNEGRAQGRDEGRAEGQRSAVLELAREKLGALAPQEEAAIAAIADSAALTELLLGLGRATSVDQARAALALAIDRGAQG
jgi:flagellar biosynthesis/type III secretory pathway protein FliH